MTELDDIDALAAEYVLGTLDRDERIGAVMRRQSELALEAAIQAWERRLGPLVEVVPAVAPPANLYSKIRAEIGLAQNVVSLRSREQHLTRRAARWRTATMGVSAMAAALVGVIGWGGYESQRLQHQYAAALQSAKAEQNELLTRHAAALQDVKAEQNEQLAQLAAVLQSAKAEQDKLQSQYKAELAAFKAEQSKMPTQYIAVLQSGKDAPAFLMTVDTRTHLCVISAITAPKQPEKSYEVWLVHDKMPKPKSLGVYEEGDMRPMPMDNGPDAALFMNATFAVSLEPQGGSPTGGPTGPVLFTGKLVQATP